MISLLRRRPGFRRLWAAGAVSLCGDWLSFVAVSVLALTHGGGPLALAVVFAAHTLPAAVLSPLAGALVDRVDRRKVLIAADVLASLATAAMALAAVLGALTAVQLLLVVRSAITSAVPPGESAALRRLVGEDELVPANAILAATWSTAYVLGMALGGLAATLGPTLALVLDAASFAIAAGLHATLPPLPVEQPGNGRAEGEATSDADPSRRSAGTDRSTNGGGPSGSPPSLLDVVRHTPRDTVVALRVAFGHRPLLAAVLGKTPLALAAGAGWIALNLIGASAHPFGEAALSFGVLQAIRGAGTGIGPALATWLVRRGTAEVVLQHAARVVMLGAVAGLAFARDRVTLSIVALAWGIGTGTNWVMSHVAIQRNAGDVVIGRLAAFDELLVSVAMAGSAVIGAVIAEHVGLGATALTGVGLGLLGLAAAAILVARAPGGALPHAQVNLPSPAGAP